MNSTTTLPTVTRFKAGDAVPENILKQTPKRDDSKLGLFVFHIDCYVMEGEECFWILPCHANERRHSVTLDGADGINVSAATKNVMFPYSTTTMYIGPVPESVTLEMDGPSTLSSAVEALGKIDDLLTNMQPHLVNGSLALDKDRLEMIDHYVGPAIDIARSAVSQIGKAKA